MSALDTQIGGDHYKKLAIQPMEYSMANKLDACQHTAIKYITRFRDKGGVADLEKAKHVIDLLIEFEGKGQPAPAAPAYPYLAEVGAHMAAQAALREAQEGGAQNASASLESRADTEKAGGAQDGWIEWKGGECPVDNNVMVQVRLENGAERWSRAEGWDWGRGEDFISIIAYRFTKEQA